MIVPPASATRVTAFTRSNHWPVLTIIPSASIPLAEIVMYIRSLPVSAVSFQAILNLAVMRTHVRERGTGGGVGLRALYHD